jgi:ribonucleoside-diphosphate reductase alpha chain
MEKEIQVVKRSKEKEVFNIDKINKTVKWAVDGIKDVSLLDIEINAKINIRDGITTEEIHQVLIESAANLITIDTPNYQYVAARLLTYQLRKNVWGGKNPPKLIDLIKKNVDVGVYTSEIFDLYSEKELNKIDEFIDHDRDFIFTYAGIKQLIDKYLVQNRKTKEIHETPQFAYILIAAICFAKYPKETRLDYIKKAYNYFSKHKINLPTPIMAGVRTPLKSFASCLLAGVDDSMASILANVSAIGHATANRYGIGFNFAHVRALGAPIRNGDVIHTGKIPFLKVFESTVKSCHQNGIRGGSATTTVFVFDYEIEDIVVLKNNAGTEENRVRKLDYSIGMSKLFYQRWLNNENITLFSSHECKDLFEKFGTEEFDNLYVKYEKDSSLKFKKTISARDLFDLITKERIETGRIYIINVDNVNSHSSWLDTVQMSNLCQEVTHPVIPLKSLEDKDAEIGICILAAINWLEISSDNEFEKVCDITVRMLDEIIDYQDYFCPAAKNFATKRRSLGIGITNLAAVLAKNNLKYDDKEAPNFVADFMEKQQYFLLKSSMELAKEKGKCEKFDRTTYSKGLLPIDHYKKDKLDAIVTTPLKMNWEALRKEIAQHGLRHSTTTAHMPCESSSVIQNSTNGFEPIRSLITYKKSKASTVPVIAPNANQWKNRYTIAFDMKDNTGYLNIVAAIQKFTDMAMSVNFYYDYSHYPNKMIPHSRVIKEMMYHYSLGGKTIYYTNTNDNDKEQLMNKEEESCAGGACTI